MHVTPRNSTFTFTTTQLPEKAGIDLFTLLIDRIPDDMRNVMLKSDREPERFGLGAEIVTILTRARRSESRSGSRAGKNW